MRTPLTFLLILICTITHANQNQVDSISNFEPVKPPVYINQTTGPGTSVLKLDLGYLSPDIDNKWALQQLAGSDVLAIDIVYSDWPKYGGFEQLTKNRIKEVGQFVEGSLNDNAVQWRLVAQADCHDRASAEKLFHGVFVYYRPKPTTASMIKEKENLKEYLKILRGEKSAELPLDQRFEITASGEVDVEEFSEPIPALTDRRIYDEMEYESTIYEMEGGKKMKVKKPKFTRPGIPDARFQPWGEDSVLLSVLKRNNWTDMMITMDVTGSMYPYTAQLFTWLALQKGQDVEQYVFFNDGNTTPDHKKLLGMTGGIYTTTSDIPQQVEATVYKTMQRGGGGDAPENDIEAILHGLNQCETCQNVILVADNWSPIKDYMLLKKLNKPVKVVLCGARNGVNLDYLNLARETGGSVHLMEEDLYDLTMMQEGEKISIHGATYKIKNGKFIRI